MLSQNIAVSLASQSHQLKNRNRTLITEKKSPILRRFRNCCRGVIHEVTGSITFAVSLEYSDRRKVPTLFLEVESCRELRNIGLGRACCPLVVIKWNDVEVGRTPGLKSGTAPIWFDECYKFPLRNDAAEESSSWFGKLSLEVWHMNSALQLVDFLGQGILEIGANKVSTFLPSKIKVINMPLTEFWQTMPKRFFVLNERSREFLPTTHSVFKCQKSSSDHEGDVAVRQSSILVEAFQKYRAPYTGRFQNKVLQRPVNFNPKQSQYKVPTPEEYKYRRRDSFAISVRDIEKEPHESSTLLRAVVMICSYLLIGVGGYSYIFENWSIRDSLYFSVVTFTTVGFGDIKPKTDGGKVFTCFFALAGIGIIGIALGYIGQNIVQAQMIRMQLQNKKSKPPLNSFESNLDDCDLVAIHEEEEEEVSGSDRMEVGTEKEANICSTQPTNHKQHTLSRGASYFLENTMKHDNQSSVSWSILVTVLPIFIMILLGSTVVGNAQKWTWVDAIYWCVSTGTSVGYGDFYPTEDYAIWFSIIFIPVGVGVISAAIGRVANVFVEREIAKSNSKLIKTEITLEDLDEMNVDNDGEVSLLEFVEYMLKSMNKVDQKLLDDLHDQFLRLDADGSGALQEDDLEILAQQKLVEHREKALKYYESRKLQRRRASLVVFPYNFDGSSFNKNNNEHTMQSN